MELKNQPSNLEIKDRQASGGNIRTMKCGNSCGGTAISHDPDDPYICPNCGWTLEVKDGGNK
jgi:predicted RNA-binding Zn-ribbon protein involved in translation (DUF1610 family)